jgi:hypothetical protein
VASRCPTDAEPATEAPGTLPHHRQLQTWIDRLPTGAADEVLVTTEDAAALTTRAADTEGAWRDPLADEAAAPDAVAASIAERMTWMTAQVDSGQYVEGVPGALEAARGIEAAAVAIDEVRVVAGETQLWCVPLTSGLFKSPVDPDFDRNRCASLHAGEPVRVVQADEASGWSRVTAGHTAGWVHTPVWTPVLPRAATAELLHGPTVVPRRDDVRTEGGHVVRLGVRLPAVEESDGRVRVQVATADGWVDDFVTLGADFAVGSRPLTRRALWEAALSELDAPYGWGGRAGERDCSRLLRDVFAGFGIELPRHSGVQALTGTANVDVSDLPETDKRAAIRAAAREGLVLVYMPGHIMLYLGDDDGRDYAVSSVSEFLTPCEGGPDTVHRLDRVAVTTLDIGRGTERTAFIERITRLVVFGPPSVPPSD